MLGQVRITPWVFRGVSKFPQGLNNINCLSICFAPSADLSFLPFIHFQALQPHKTSQENISAWLAWPGNYCHFSILHPKEVHTGPSSVVSQRGLSASSQCRREAKIFILTGTRKAIGAFQQHDISSQHLGSLLALQERLENTPGTPKVNSNPDACVSFGYNSSHCITVLLLIVRTHIPGTPLCFDTSLMGLH